MNFICSYCFEAFNSKSNLPMKLSCEHILCCICVEYLKDYQFPQACPFDNEIVDYSSAILSQKTLDLLPYICSLHNQQYIGLCKNHNQPLCKSCTKNHQNCLSIIKGPEELENCILETIAESKNKSEKIFEESKKKYIEDMNDGICWAKSESNAGISELKEIIAIKNFKKLARDFDDTDADKMIKEASETRNRILKILENTNIKEKNIRDRKAQISKIKRPFMELVEEYFLIGKSDGELGEHLRLLGEKEMDSKILKSKYFPLFCLPYIVNNFEDYFTVVIESRYRAPALITGIGIGTPIDQSGYVFVQELLITCGSSQQSIQNAVIEYDPERITKVLYLECPILWNINTKVIINIFTQGKRSYFFSYYRKNDDFTRYDIDGELFKGIFPVFFFTVETDY